MISELFYPKELREVIADLRAKDDLNENAIDALPDVRTTFVFGWCVIVSMAVVAGNFDLLGGLVLTVVLFAVAMLWVWMQARDCSKRMMVYMKGGRKVGVVHKIWMQADHSPYWHAGRCYISIKNIATSEIVSSGPFKQWHAELVGPKKGDAIFYYTLGRWPHQNMPDRGDVKKQYCLSKSMLKSDNYT